MNFLSSLFDRFINGKPTVTAGDAAPGETTDAQRPPQEDVPLAGSASGQVQGFAPPEPGDYETYRKISQDETVALVKMVATAPIIAGDWMWKSKKGVPKRQLNFAKQTFDSQRPVIVRDMLRALEFGWAGFEKVWATKDGRQVISRLKPLLWDITTILTDAGGNVIGLRNQPKNGQGVDLVGSKFFHIKVGGDAGDPYGCGRNETVRTSWSRGEQTAERLQQYYTKVAKIIPQIHYPIGTSKNQAGADWPNEWMARDLARAIAAGKPVFMPKTPITIDPGDPRMAEVLAKMGPDWIIDFLNPGGSDMAAGLLAGLARYDVLKVRGWLRPERAVLEAGHGSRADAVAHTDTGTLDSQQVAGDVCAAFSQGVLDDQLSQNFAGYEPGDVWVEPSPITSDEIQVYVSMATAMLSNQLTAPMVSRLADLPAMLEELGVPMDDDVRSKWKEIVGGLATPPTAAGTSGAKEAA